MQYFDKKCRVFYLPCYEEICPRCPANRVFVLLVECRCGWHVPVGVEFGVVPQVETGLQYECFLEDFQFHEKRVLGREARQTEIFLVGGELQQVETPEPENAQCKVAAQRTLRKQCRLVGLVGQEQRRYPNIVCHVAYT